ncbi:DNA mismatch repair ATPase MutS family [Methanobrevibacter ruminantium M1]|uniref:DNA-binding protein MutS2 n=1 Tax=Methanobrevibacter ruminantium (strain ATCC 35063 / DSM 1093 / JCM 13430 / OCM 146 / M1) TaxID=634498 RepID=D3E1M3_METRM|nr:DNA mismatch repair protein MutS [Methanobrevibacter ruminantium]ADC46434.1 DNA mismatch repair ATPase MutS family [Methanobrevibacter ruminantium M1]
MEGSELQNIKGIGDKLSQKILLNLGGEEELNRVINELDLERLIQIEGISQRKAIEIMNQLLGNPAQKFLKSERAIQLYEEIIEKILKYSNTNYSKNRILLLAPIKDEFIIAERLSFVMSAKERVSKLPLDELNKLMRNLHEPKNAKANYDASKAILVESAEDSDYLMDLGLNKYYTILTASDSPFFKEEISGYELVYYIYSEGILDFGDMPNLIMISKEAEDYQLVPEIILDYFKENRELFENVCKIRKILGESTVLEDVGPVLEELDNYKTQEIDLDGIVQEEKTYIDEELKTRIHNVDLEGDEVLDLLNNALPPKIEKIFDEILSKSKENIKAKSGIDFDPFIKKYPIEIDDMEMERIKMEILSSSENNYFDMKITAAEHLALIKEQAEREVKETIEFDFEYALGSFAYHYKLNAPEFSNEYALEGALHLELCLKETEEDNENGEIQRIDYKLNEQENVALLTGANSGGKTTLLETISQIAILAQMGLPVPANMAKIKLLDEIYHFSKKRSLDAGAFESFLNVFMPIVTSDCEKLVLLDELEGITELEAAVKIISSFIEMIKDSNSFAIIVTHMANELMKYTDIRVDGIEATGLDENYNLIVDRTPKMNYLAKSTPELIIKRMYENSSPELKKVYGKILEKF